VARQVKSPCGSCSWAEGKFDECTSEQPDATKHRIRFCTTEDGVRIAYATSGQGLPVVRPGHWLTHLEYDVKSPVFLPLLSRLSQRHMLVRYDRRGTGMSDRNVAQVSYARGRKDREDEEFTPAMEETMCALIRSGWGSDDDA
jgi:pimeloyl-ACP methyl ester carboxylesterase